MKLRKVSPDAIGIPETRVTARFDDETWEQFQSSIKEMGAIAPIICCQVEAQLSYGDKQTLLRLLGEIARATGEGGHR